MLKTGNKKYYNVKGIQINDPSINEGTIMTEGIFGKHDDLFRTILIITKLLRFGI
jgi:hypothetical protein